MVDAQVAIILNQLKIDFRIITIGSDWPKKRNIFSKYFYKEFRKEQILIMKLMN